MFARLSLATAFLLLGFALPSSAQEKLSREEARAQAALKRLEERIQAGTGNQGKLRQELAAFRLAHLGTRAATRAAELFAEFPSPLDRMDPSTIAALEKFDWQPKELVGVLGEHRGRHGAAVASVAFSSDGKRVASGGGQYVRYWDSATMRLLGMGGHGAVTSVALSKDGKFVVSASAYGSVAVWDLPDAKTVRHRYTISVATSAVYGVAVHPDNKVIACACYDNVVRLYDVSGPKSQERGEVSGHGKPVRCVAYSPDGKLLATGSEDLTARIWDTSTPDYKEKSRLVGHDKPIHSVAFNRAGTTLATGSADGSVRLWTVPAAAKAKVPRLAFQGPKGAVTSLSFSPKGTTLATTGVDGKVRLWGVSTAKVLKPRLELDGHQALTQAVAYSPDGKLLVSGGDDWTVRTWDQAKGKQGERFVPWSHLSHVYSVAYATDGATLASGSYDRVVRFWDLARPEPKTRNYLKFEAPVYAVAYSPDGKMVAAGGQTTTIKQWDAKGGTTRPNLKNNPSWVYNLCYSPDSKYLLAASDKEAILFEAGRGGVARRFGPHKTRVTSINFSPDGKLALSTSGYYLYEKGKIVIRDGKHVYTDCVLKVWGVEDGAEAAQFEEAKTPFYAAAFSADGAMVFAGNYEPALRRWSFAGNKPAEKESWKGAHGYVHGIWPTADGKYLLTRGLDQKLVLWEMATGKRLKDWTLNEVIGGVAVAADGRHIALGLGTGVIYVLRIAPAKRKASG